MPCERLTGSACSSPSPRPVVRPTLAIPGISISSFSSRRPKASAVSRLAPGGRLMTTCALPSLKGGRNSLPRVASTRMLAVASAPVTATTPQGCAQESAIMRPPMALACRTTNESPWRSVARELGSSHQHRTGVTVSETTSEARMLTT